MRAIISVVLIALLLATPVTQVLGQAHQQASIAPQPSTVNPPPIHSGALLEPVSWESWVPTLESTGATQLNLAPGAVGRWDTTHRSVTRESAVGPRARSAAWASLHHKWASLRKSRPRCSETVLTQRQQVGGQVSNVEAPPP